MHVEYNNIYIYVTFVEHSDIRSIKKAGTGVIKRIVGFH